MAKPYAVQRYRNGFAIKWTDATGKQRRRQLAALDKPSAEAEARALWQQAERGPRTVGRIVDAYRRDREAAGIVTVQRQADAWKAMASFWQNVLPENIDDQMCRDYAKQRSRAPGTLIKELSMLAVALRFGVKAGLLDKAPSIWRPAPPEQQERHLTKDQFTRFLDGCKAPHMRLYAVVAVCTAARPAAVLELTWDRVNFERRQIDLNPAKRVQTAKKRPVVAINDIAFDVLREAYKARISNTVVAWGGSEIASIKKAFQAASARSGVRATPYTLRHTAAVWMAETSVPMEQIQQFLGHDDIRTTIKYYARYSPQFLRAAANAITW